MNQAEWDSFIDGAQEIDVQSRREKKQDALASRLKAIINGTLDPYARNGKGEQYAMLVVGGKIQKIRIKNT